MTEDSKLKTQEAVMNVDYYLRVVALQNLLIKKGILSKEEFETEYTQLATTIVSKFKKDKEEKK